MAGRSGAMVREEEIELLYDAAFEPSRWSELFRRWLARLGSDRIIVFSGMDGDPAVRLFEHAGHDPQYLRKYFAQYLGMDPWTNEARRHGLTLSGRTTINEEVVPRKTMQQSAFFNECLRPEGIAHRAAITISDGQAGTGPPLTLTVHRNAWSRPFDVSLHGELQWMGRHIGRAATMRASMLRTQTERTTMVAVLDAMPNGAIVVDCDGRIAHANQQGEALLRRGGALRAGSSLRASNLAENSRLSAMIAGATGVGGPRRLVGGILRLDRGPDVAPLLVTISPLPGGSGIESARGRLALVLLTDPQAKVPDLEGHLRAFFQLSHAEVRVVSALAEGATRAEVAARWNISTETVATHVKRSMAKTGTARQQELLSLVRTLHNAVPNQTDSRPA